MNATDEQYDDTAQQLVAVALPNSIAGGGDLGAMADIVTLASGATLAGFLPDGFDHVSGSHLGVSYNYALACKDAGGNTLVGCTALSQTADAKAVWSGTLTLPNITAMVNRSGDWEVSSLLDSPAVFTGSAALVFDATVTSIFRPVTTTYSLSADADYDAVKIDTMTKRPVGGRITYSITAMTTVANADSKLEFDVDAVLTFASYGIATLGLDGTHRYLVNTATGVIVKIN